MIKSVIYNLHPKWEIKTIMKGNDKMEMKNNVYEMIKGHNKRVETHRRMWDNYRKSGDIDDDVEDYLVTVEFLLEDDAKRFCAIANKNNDGTWWHVDNNDFHIFNDERDSVSGTRTYTLDDDGLIEG